MMKLSLYLQKRPGSNLRFVIAFIISLLSSQFAFADVVLKGKMKIGDYTYRAMGPQYLVTADRTWYGNLKNPKPNKPIHFNLTEAITLTQIKVHRASGIGGQLYFVIWKAGSNTPVVNTRSELYRYSSSLGLSVNLPKGDYELAIVGQCYNWPNGLIGWDKDCRNFDDFNFKNITLKTSVGNTDSFSFLQRRHIGDNDEYPRDGYAGRWYPDKDEGDNAKYEFKPLRDGSVDSIIIYNYRDLVRHENNVRLTLTNKNTGEVISQRYLRSGTTTGDYIWSIKRKFKSKNTYELKIDVSRFGDNDDMSWDDIVVKFEADTPPPAIDHYKLTYSDHALTCEAAVVKVQACTNTFQSGSACVESTNLTSATLVGNAKVGSGSISESSGPFIGSTDINLGYLDSGDLTLSLTGIGNKYYKCNGTSNCDINFADTGFFFSYDNADGSDNIASQVAGVNFSKPIKLDAFYNKNGQCKNIFKNNEIIPVKLGVQCQEPNRCSSLNFVVNGVNLGKNGGNEENDYNAVNLAFSHHIAQVNTAQYQDAGKINLIASYTINDNRNDLDGLTIKGQSNQFAVRPYKFKIKATRHDNAIRTELTAQDNNVLKHVHKAGDIFAFKIQSLNADGNITSNYVPNSNDNLRIKLTRSMPTADLFEGKFSYAKNKTLLTSTSATWAEIPDLPTFDKGVYSFADSTYSEVGAIQINVKDTDYYGMVFSVDDNFSANSNGTEIGRFIPSHFELVSSKVDNYVGARGYVREGHDYEFPNGLSSYVAGTTVLQPKDGNVYECRTWPNNGYCVQWSEGSNQYEPGIGRNWEMAWILLASPGGGAVFTYMDQPELLFDYRLEAQNSAGFVTRNYNGDDKATVSFIANANGRDLSSRLVDYGGVWSDGVYQPIGMQDRGYFSRQSTGPDGPMMNTLFGIGITDKDDVVLNDLNLPATPDTATARMLSLQTSELRYGRWTIADGYGPISNDFATTMQIEYFNGTNFIKNNDDSITDFDFVDATLTDISLGGILPALSGNGNFTNGITQELIIAAPNRNGEVKLDYTVDNWFKYKWVDGHVGFDQSPSANIVFGFFYGNDRVIYRRRLN
ncbi:DUF6701 domain-containing protein [Moritella viscosa]|uniref:MSHA biogenesis protein MshQ n=1 Tax=Moritella viscosa TaxID=80854 RepID=A0ABY1HDC8_9GAMM|nr:DUF6701 domain-containing protein [Moritella viscosa]SGY92318.1 MSHA biogenesis protein MshQ [Moritella viscosa]SGZ03000.1 MSHA biogenesis protein MshQ [Moritella viscosa]SHO08293.1 MSHA biogenesis protein MshQ [Moritella viscosa]SHO22126.1 MSHA biogenesis protein MshQ [Moritella viscosa]SHO26450.1 MSHA biogenesis protein MshQ [Moritella viscosa]